MHALADDVVVRAQAAIRARGRFAWALAGGKTPEELYRLLAGPEYAPRIDWGRVHFFWSDERCVPPDNADSNYRMARASLLDVVHPTPEHVHRMQGELEPSEAARRYEAELRSFFAISSAEPAPAASAPAFPEFDLILLGMGADGHTASLFPGTAALEETQRWVVDNRVAQLGARLTFTLPVLNAAARVSFLVAGADKAERLSAVLGDPEGTAFPAQRVRPHGALAEWFVDGDAGALLKGIP
jgi:6-phosphogluconolactonase